MSSTEGVNFYFPIPDVLENDRLKLVPFVLSVHSKPFLELANKYPEVYTHIPWGPFEDEATFNKFMDKIFFQDRGWVLFAILDKTSNGALAGALAFIKTYPDHLNTEIGAVQIFPPFQRTHVASNAVGLLLNYALNLPEEGGLGLRRVVWQANSVNKASIRLAERLGFQFEGILRWDRVMPGTGKAGNGKELREGDPKSSNVGRDTAILGLCWDDWVLNGARDHVANVMARVK
ncbi:hypothetical protein H1R20_g16524, partial [Candolleomyces eurysporus]